MFGVYEGVQYNQMDEDFLAYSSLSGETVVLSQLACFILTELLSEPKCFSDLLDKLKRENYENAEFSLRTTLNELSKRGFVYCQ